MDVRDHLWEYRRYVACCNNSYTFSFQDSIRVLNTYYMTLSYHRFRLPIHRTKCTSLTSTLSFVIICIATCHPFNIYRLPKASDTVSKRSSRCSNACHNDFYGAAEWKRMVFCSDQWMERSYDILHCSARKLRHEMYPSGSTCLHYRNITFLCQKKLTLGIPSPLFETRRQRFIDPLHQVVWTILRRGYFLIIYIDSQAQWAKVLTKPVSSNIEMHPGPIESENEHNTIDFRGIEDTYIHSSSWSRACWKRTALNGGRALNA